MIFTPHDLDLTQEEEMLLFGPGVLVARYVDDWDPPNWGLVQAVLQTYGFAEQVGWKVVRCLEGVETWGDSRNNCFCGQNRKVLMRIVRYPTTRIEWFRGKYRAAKIQRAFALEGILNHSTWSEYKFEYEQRQRTWGHHERASSP